MDRRKRTARTVALMSLFSMTETQENVPVASFDGDGSDLVSLIVGIEPVQSGSGDPSPDNVRPISGWTGATVTRTGKNLINIPNFENTSCATIVESTRSIFGSFPYEANTQYTFQCDCVVDSSQAFGMYISYGDGTSEYKWFSRFGIVNKSVTTKANATVSFTIFAYDSITLVSLSDFMMEKSSTATSYEPYSGTTYSITFPSSAGTVYGGTLDVTTGKLTVDRAAYALDGTEAGAMSTSPQYPHLYTTGVLPYAGVQLPFNQNYCSHYKSLAGNFNESCFYLQTPAAQKRVSFNDIRFTTATEYANYFAAQYAAGTPVTVCYMLATPIVYDLTPTEINTLIGTNNIWADTGEIKYIEYNV